MDYRSTGILEGRNTLRRESVVSSSLLVRRSHPLGGSFGSDAPIGIDSEGNHLRVVPVVWVNRELQPGQIKRWNCFSAPRDPAQCCGENSWPRKVHHRLEDSSLKPSPDSTLRSACSIQAGAGP